MINRFLKTVDFASLQNRAVMGLTVLGLFFWNVKPIRANDIWWHLETGRRIWLTGRIPRVDPYSWTMRGHAWINFEWLYDALLYPCYALTGWLGIIILKSLIVASLLWVFGRRCQQRGCSPAVAAVAMVGAFYVMRPGLAERPELLSFLGVSALLLLLDKLDQNPVYFSRWVWWWPAIFSVWANVHGGFAVGLGVLVIWSVGAWLSRRPIPRYFLGWVVLNAAATWVNPLGLGLHRFVFKVVGLAQRSPASEWGSPPFTHMAPFWIALVLALGLGIQAYRLKKLQWAPALLVLVTAVAACRHARHVPLFVLAGIPYVFAGLDFRAFKWDRKWSWVPIVMIFAWTVLGARGVQAGITPSIMPQQALDAIERERLPGPFYNDWDLGSYWIWRFKGNPGVFLDSRSGSVAGYTALREQVMRAQQTPAAWASFLDQYAIQTALIRNPQSWDLAEFTGLYFPPASWTRISVDRNFILVTRQKGRDLKRTASFGHRR